MSRAHGQQRVAEILPRARVEGSADRGAVRIGQRPVEPPVQAQGVDQDLGGGGNIECVEPPLSRHGDGGVDLRAQGGGLGRVDDLVSAQGKGAGGGALEDITLHQQGVGTRGGQHGRVEPIGRVAQVRHQPSGAVQQAQRHRAGGADRRDVQPVPGIGRDGVGQGADRRIHCHRHRGAQGQRRRRAKVEQPERVGARAVPRPGDGQRVIARCRVKAHRVALGARDAVGAGEIPVLHHAARSGQLPGQVAVGRQRIGIEDRPGGEGERMDIALPRDGDLARDGLAEGEGAHPVARVHQPEPQRLRRGDVVLPLQRQQVGAGLGQGERAEIVDEVRARDQLPVRVQQTDIGVRLAVEIVEIDDLFRRSREFVQDRAVAGIERGGNRRVRHVPRRDGHRRAHIQQTEGIPPRLLEVHTHRQDIMSRHEDEHIAAAAVGGVGIGEVIATDPARRSTQRPGDVAGIDRQIVEHHPRRCRDVEGVAARAVNDQDRIRHGLAKGDRARVAGPRDGGDGDVVDVLGDGLEIAPPLNREAAGDGPVAGHEHRVEHRLRAAALGGQDQADHRAAIGLAHRERGVDRRPGSHVDVQRADEHLPHQPGPGADRDVVGGAVAAIAVVHVNRDAKRIGQPGIGAQIGSDTAVAPGVGIQQREQQRAVASAALRHLDREIEIDRHMVERPVLGQRKEDRVVLIAVGSAGQAQRLARRAGNQCGGRAGGVAQGVGQQRGGIEILRGLAAGVLRRDIGDGEGISERGARRDRALDQQCVGTGDHCQRPGIARPARPEH